MTGVTRYPRNGKCTSVKTGKEDEEKKIRTRVHYCDSR